MSEEQRKPFIHCFLRSGLGVSCEVYGNGDEQLRMLTAVAYSVSQNLGVSPTRLCDLLYTILANETNYTPRVKIDMAELRRQAGEGGAHE